MNKLQTNIIGELCIIKICPHRIDTYIFHFQSRFLTFVLNTLMISRENTDSRLSMLLQTEFNSIDSFGNLQSTEPINSTIL